jgi:hypothetical protein
VTKAASDIGGIAHRVIMGEKIERTETLKPKRGWKKWRAALSGLGVFSITSFLGKNTSRYPHPEYGGPSDSSIGLLLGIAARLLGLVHRVHVSSGTWLLVRSWMALHGHSPVLLHPYTRARRHAVLHGR